MVLVGSSGAEHRLQTRESSVRYERVRVVFGEDAIHHFESGRLNVKCALPFLNQRRWE